MPSVPSASPRRPLRTLRVPRGRDALSGEPLQGAAAVYPHQTAQLPQAQAAVQLQHHLHHLPPRAGQQPALGPHPAALLAQKILSVPGGFVGERQEQRGLRYLRHEGAGRHR